MSVQACDKVLLIANPLSGGGRAGAWVDRVADAFRRGGLPTEPFLTGKAGDGREAASQAPPGTLIVAFGGDGTVNEILNGADLARSTLAVVPAGTGNVLAKELGMSRRPIEAAGQILSGRTVRLDVGVCNGRRFICVFGAGVDAHIVRKVHEKRGRALTQFHYIPHVVRSLLPPRRWRMSVEVDGQTVADGVDQVAVGNTRSYGGPMEMTPAASPSSGVLDVMCASIGSLTDVLTVTVCGLLRSLDRTRRVLYVRGRRIVVTAPEPDVPYEVDGEAAGFLPAEVAVLPRAVTLRAPITFRPPRLTARARRPGRSGR